MNSYYLFTIITILILVIGSVYYINYILEDNQNAEYHIVLSDKEDYKSIIKYKRVPVITTRPIIKHRSKPGMFITRHLQRIDGPDIPVEEAQEWHNIYVKLPGFIENPYISKRNGHKRVINKILNQMKPDIIITSPFVRCIQTSIIIAKRTGIDLKNIYIDYNLGEWNANHLFKKPFNSEQIFNHSIKYLTNKNLLRTPMKDCYIKNRNVLGPIINDQYQGNKFEDINKYAERVKDEIVRLGHEVKNNNVNVLIVTHSIATKALVKSVNPGYAMNYEDVIDISQYIE